MAEFHCVTLYDLGDFLLCDLTESCIDRVNLGNLLSCLIQFLLGLTMVPRENKCLFKIWGDKQRVLWYFAQWPINSTLMQQQCIFGNQIFNAFPLFLDVSSYIYIYIYILN